MKNLTLVEFPDEEEIKRRIQVIQTVVDIKKKAFLNALNTNLMPDAIRELYTDPVKKEVYKWVQGVDIRTLQKLNEAIGQQSQ